MSTTTRNFDRFRVRRAASNPLVLPKIPEFPKEVAAKLVTLKPYLESYNRAIEQWRQQVQLVLEQAIMALKLDPGDIEAQVAEYIKTHPSSTSDETKVSKSGDTMTGQLTLANENPGNGLDAVCADWVTKKLSKTNVTLDQGAERMMTMVDQKLTLDKQDSNKFLAGPISGDSAAPEFRIIRLLDLLESFSTFTPVINRDTGKVVEVYVTGTGDSRQINYGNEFDLP